MNETHDLNRPIATYRHRQRGPWWFLLGAIAATFLTVSWMTSQERFLSIMFLVIGLAMIIVCFSMQHLNVVDQGQYLRIFFGPLPVFRKRIAYSDIEEIRRDKTTVLDGWGIHLSIRGGWVWNIWGFDCVLLRLRGRLLRIGTDDAEQLVRFLQLKTQTRQPFGSPESKVLE